MKRLLTMIFAFIMFAAECAFCGVAKTIDFPSKRSRKYLIACGHDLMHARLQDYERKVKEIADIGFDGIAISICYVWPDEGKERKLTDPFHGRTGEVHPISIRKADFSNSRNTISKIMKDGALPKSMLRVGLTSKNRIDWRDDAAWKIAADNLGFLAEFAKETGLAGIVFDEEDYSEGRQFFTVESDPPPSELASLVRRRGREVFEAVFRAYPNITFHSSWLFSTIQKWHAWVTPELGLDQSALAESFGELWGHFMNGAIDAMPSRATIVEGNEERGYHGNADKNEFTVAAWRTSRGASEQVSPENRRKFLSQLSVSFGQYADSYINKSTSEYYHAPLGGSRLKRWHENLQGAINVADDYVWIYGEKGTYVNWERDLSKSPGVDTARCYYYKTWEEQLPGFSRMLKVVKGDYSPIEEDIVNGRMKLVGGLDSTWSKDKNPPRNRFERNVMKGALSSNGFARLNGSGCFCSRVKVKPGDELYVKASVKGCNPRVAVSFLKDGKFDFKRFGRPRTIVPPAGWNHGEWQDLRSHFLIPDGVTEVSITFGGPATFDNPNCFDCVGIYKTIENEEIKKLSLVLDADRWADIVPDTWSGPKAKDMAEGRIGLHDFTVRSNTSSESIDWNKPKKVRVKNVNGCPQFTVDGKAVYALWGTVRSDREVRHSTAPLNFVTVWNSPRKWWPRKYDFDPSEIDRKAEWHIRRYPDSFLIWDITVYPPPDWREANPDEIVHNEKGVLNKRNANSVNYSFASRKAIDDMLMMVEKVVRHIESAPYANRIAGYRINSGHTAEWLGWDCIDKETALDFSPVAKKGFAEFLSEFYPGIQDTSVPTMSERTLLDAPYSVVWDLPKHMRTFAYHDFYSRILSDCALMMCRKTREIVGEDKLIGTYFGYVMTLMEYGDGHMKAHYSTKRFLDGVQGIIDFIMSPPAYEYWNRGLGDTLMDMKPFASIQDHGIMPVIEDDTRTYRNIALKSNGYSQGRTYAHTVNLMRRNMGIAICRGQPFYTYAITSGSEFDYPQFAKDAAELRRFGDCAIAKGTSRNAEIAIVVSEESIKAMPDMRKSNAECLPVPIQWYPPSGKVVRRTETYGRPFVSDVFGRLGSRAARIGAPVDYRLVEDLADNPGNYKMYLFTNSLLNDPSVSRAVKKLREKDCMIVWTYAPGYVSYTGNSVSSMKELTGMEFERCPDGMDSKIICADGTIRGGTGHPVSPLFRVKGEIEVLGRYDNGDCAFASAKTGRAQSVFYGSYYIELPVLRYLAKRAGVHVYSDTTDPIEANENFVTMHARFAGKKTICLPKRSSVYDVFGGEIIAKDVTEFTFDAPLHSSWLFYCADDESELNRDILKK